MTFQMALRYFFRAGISTIIKRTIGGDTYICLDILVLEIEGVFPNVDANKRCMGKKGILIGGSCYHQSFSSGINTLANEIETLKCRII